MWRQEPPNSTPVTTYACRDQKNPKPAAQIPAQTAYLNLADKYPVRRDWVVRTTRPHLRGKRNAMLREKVVLTRRMHTHHQQHRDFLQALKRYVVASLNLHLSNLHCFNEVISCSTVTGPQHSSFTLLKLRAKSQAPAKLSSAVAAKTTRRVTL
jgi:hypothetical protein